MIPNNVTKLIKALKRNRIEAEFFASKSELLDSFRDFLSPSPNPVIVGVGDSKTLEQLGIYALLRKSDCVFLDKYNRNLSRAEKDKLYRQNFSADLFISGVNAITLEGRIFNLDGNGSRVAPIIFGPKRVLLICSTNKIVENDEEAIYRIENIAAPIDAKRLNKNIPCVETGTCINCKSKDKICNYYTIIQGQFDSKRIKVLLIEGEYGF